MKTFHLVIKDFLSSGKIKETPSAKGDWDLLAIFVFTKRK